MTSHHRTKRMWGKIIASKFTFDSSLTTFEERWESANQWLVQQDITLDNEEDRKYLDKVYSWVMKKDNQFPDEDKGQLEQHHLNVLADHQFKGIRT